MKRLATALSLARVGPLLTKELLVTSRRPRYYLLRFAYAAVLGLYVSLVWLGFVEQASGASAVYRTAHMSEMGKQIVSYIVCFQFGLAQLVAAVLLSTAISEEIYQRTLVPILTTPIGMWQIVAGKFLGRLLHVGLLLAVSLPLMGVVRVLGGVPWNYLLAGVCITVTACMFLGAVAMLFSVLCRRGYLSILATAGAAGGLYGVVGLVLLIIGGIGSAALGKWAMCVPLYPNPVAAMVHETVALHDPSATVPGFYWPIHCLLMLAATYGVLRLCQLLVGRVAIRKAIGMGAGQVDETDSARLAVRPPMLLEPVDASEAERSHIRLLNAAPQVAPPPRRQPAEAPAAKPGPPRERRWRPKGWGLSRVIGSPIVWRELRKPLLRDRVVQLVATGAAVFYLIYTYAILGATGAMDDPGVHVFFVQMFLLAAMVCTAVDASTTIAPERQARTWPSLLSTPVSDWHILLGKAGGSAFRCLPVWLFLAAHVLLFSAIGHLHPLAILHVGLIAVGAFAVLLALGTFLSARCRRPTTAVLLSAGLPVIAWGLLPVGTQLLGQVLGDRELADAVALANPITQAWVITDAAGRATREAYLAGWPDWHRGASATTVVLLASFLAHALLAVGLLAISKRRLRHHTFRQ